MATSVRLNPETEQRLDCLASHTRRTNRFSSRCGFVIEVRSVVLANARMGKALP